jgi:ABC-2 type transport system permease protein
MVQRTLMITWKEFIQISRDPRMLGVVVVLPVLMLLLYGYAINLDVKHLRLAVFDQSRSPDSRDLIGAFSRSEYFEVVEMIHDEPSIGAALDEGKAVVVLVIPATYARDLAGGRTAQVQLIIDGSDSTSASTAVGYANGVFLQHSLKVSVNALQRQGAQGASALIPVDNRTRFWFNAELHSPNYIIPGLIAVILAMLSALLTSMTVVRERERGTIESLIVSPVRPIELMTGKILPYAIIAFFDVILVMSNAVLIFDIPLRGNPLLVMASSFTFLLAALGIGLLISTVAKSQQIAMMAAVTATQLPTVILSGFIFPISSMEKPIQWLTNIIPATHFIRILRAIFLKGTGAAHVWQPALVLLLLGLGLLALSAKKFRKKL